jgi:hypothetical protein
MMLLLWRLLPAVEASLSITAEMSCKDNINKPHSLVKMTATFAMPPSRGSTEGLKWIMLI